MFYRNLVLGPKVKLMILTHTHTHSRKNAGINRDKNQISLLTSI